MRSTLPLICPDMADIILDDHIFARETLLQQLFVILETLLAFASDFHPFVSFHFISAIDKKKLKAEADTAEVNDEEELMFLTKAFFFTASQVEQISE